MVRDSLLAWREFGKYLWAAYDNHGARELDLAKLLLFARNRRSLRGREGSFLGQAMGTLSINEQLKLNQGLLIVSISARSHILPPLPINKSGLIRDEHRGSMTHEIHVTAN